MLILTKFMHINEATYFSFYAILKLGRLKENIFATESTEKHLQLDGCRSLFHGLKTVRPLILSEMPKDPTQSLATTLRLQMSQGFCASSF